MNSSPISQQISQNEIDGNNCFVLQVVNDNNDNFLTVQMDDIEGLEEISTSTAMEIEGPKMLGEDDIIGGMPRKGMQFPSADEAREFIMNMPKEWDLVFARSQQRGCPQMDLLIKNILFATRQEKEKLST
ncbi:hypothetical protein SLA2020_129110 [Shorea laevis]